jgi:type I restriction enzyme, S subunit
MSVRLPDHLDLIATAPAGIQKLRGLILELAVRGKLVPQDPNDEPASDLLKRIAKERARLEVEGTCKKSKAKPLDAGDAPPFELPAGWVLSQLSDLALVLNGRAYSKDELLSEGAPVLRVGNLFTSNHWYYSNLQLEADKYCDQGDLLYSWSASFGPFIWQGPKVIYHYHIWKLRLFDESSLSKEFFYKFLLEKTAEIKAAGHGVSMIHMTKEKMEKILVALPPLAEQHRIVAKVDELMALCDRLEAEQADAGAAHARLVATLLGTLTQSADAANWQRLAEHFDTLFTTEASLDALKQTILQLAVMGKLVPQDPNDEPASELLKRVAKERARLEAEGACRKLKPVLPVGDEEQAFSLPIGWKWSRFSAYAIDVSTGPFGSMLHQTDYVLGGIPLVNPSHMIGGRIVPEKHVAVAESKAMELSNYRLQDGDIVMARRGEVGRTALVTRNEDGWLCGTGSFVIRLASEAPRRFIVMLFRAASVRRYLGDEAVGTTMVNLNHGILNNMPVAIPPFAEQHRIVAKVDELLALVDRLKADLADSSAQQERLATTLIESALQAA